MVSLRLLTIASFIEKGKIVADIGTDHAFLPIYLIKNKIASKVYGIDNKKKPLESAKKNIVVAGVENIELILSDGLMKVPTDCQTVVFAGLGSKVVIDILNRDLKKMQDLEDIIIQVNVGSENVRRWVSDNNWIIINEVNIKENNEIYDIIQIKKGSHTLSEDEIIFGPILIKAKDEIFKEKWQNYLLHYQNIHNKIPKENNKKTYYRDFVEKIKSILKDA